MRPDEGQTEYEEVQKELSSKEEELEVVETDFKLSALVAGLPAITRWA